MSFKLSSSQATATTLGKPSYYLTDNIGKLIQHQDQCHLLPFYAISWSGSVLLKTRSPLSDAPLEKYTSALYVLISGCMVDLGCDLGLITASPLSYHDRYRLSALPIGLAT